MINECINCKNTLIYKNDSEGIPIGARCCKTFYKNNSIMFMHKNDQIYIDISKQLDVFYISINNKISKQFEYSNTITKNYIINIIESLIFL